MASYYRTARRTQTKNDFQHLIDWRQDGDKWLCLVCKGAKPRKLSDALEHERRSIHRDSRERARVARAAAASAHVPADPAPGQPASTPEREASSSSTSAAFLEDWTGLLGGSKDVLDAIVDSFQEARDARLAAVENDDSNTADSFDFAPPEPSEPYIYRSAAERQAADRLARDLYRRNHPDDPDVTLSSDDEACEHPVSEMDSDAENISAASAPRQDMKGRADPTQSRQTNTWFPWASRQECALDVLTHLRRSALSRNQVSLLTWFATFNGATGMPSEHQMRDLDKLLQDLCGISTIDYIGAMGNRFSVNSLAEMLAQEWANPRVRRHIRDLPEDAGQTVQEAWQTQHWLSELPDHLATPMVRIGKNDFFVFEPALLHSERVCMPFRWFSRGGRVFARAWAMTPIARQDDRGVVTEGWNVHEYDILEIPADELLLPLPILASQHELYSIPSPAIIFGSFLTASAFEDRQLTAWTRTDPSSGNRWRTLARGARVKAVPCWLYGDDTSGNQSKKWNKHNSFLFTLAGLPRAHAHQEYNIHFLVTSNVAETTEMLDAVVSQFEEAQESGIWAYDCEDDDLVLLIPSVFAMLGDNPMQSEFCCHIGMRGRFFCRTCWVEGKTRKADGGKGGGSDESSGNESVASAASTQSKSKGHRKGAAVETMSQMISRLRNFTKPGLARAKGNARQNLSTIREAVFRGVGAQAEFAQSKTRFGAKDTFFESFAQRFFQAIKGKRGEARDKAASDCRARFPASLESPVWRLDELDPHRDTPVEVLHVVLLGVIKYFWRDVVNNQCKSAQDRAELIARLNSVDVRGLGIPPLRGETLVNYAGSLVGRDFRTIVQVAPFVLHGLVSDKCYDAWTCLSNLVPQIWQPRIENMDQYLDSLTCSINDLLAATAKWSPSWFNKPKFHILVHLPAHIRRFGPAILFATEGFESFNAVIRIKSIHSNRQAPSRDIAVAFAQGDRVRHLLSGGYFFPRTVHATRAERQRRTPAIDLSRPRGERPRAYTALRPQIADGERPLCAGAAALSLVTLHPIVHQYLGLPDEELDRTVTLARGNTALCQFSGTETGKSGALPTLPPNALVSRCKSIDLLNGDVATPQSWVIVKPAAEHSTPRLGRVEEMLSTSRGDTTSGHVLLLRTPAVPPSELSPGYKMPVVPKLDNWSVVPAEDALCAVNVQHNCSACGCKASGTTAVRQERFVTAKTVPAFAHSPAEDWILNTGQMRDAIHVRKLAVTSPPWDLERAIHDGVAEIIKLRKQQATSAVPRPPASATPSQHPLSRAPLALSAQSSAMQPQSHQQAQNQPSDRHYNRPPTVVPSNAPPIEYRWPISWPDTSAG